MIQDNSKACSAQSYPFFELKLDDRVVEHEVQLVWIENQWLKIAVSPSLGGRIMAIKDLRTQTEVLALPEKLNLKSDNSRGVELCHGIEFLSGRSRLNGLGQVEYQVREPADDEGPVAIFVHEWLGNVSWHGAITLSSDRANIIVEQKIQNRSWTSSPLRSGLRVHGLAENRTWINESSTGGFTVLDPDYLLAFCHADELATMLPDSRMGGHRSDEWQTELAVFSNIGTPLCSSKQLSIGKSGNDFITLAHSEVRDAKIFLSINEQTFESTFSAQVGTRQVTDISSLPGEIDQILVTDSGKAELCRFPAPKDHKPQAIDNPTSFFDQLVGNSKINAREFLKVQGMEPYACHMMTLEAIKYEDWQQADDSINKYLGFLAEDGLAWWLKGAIQRESGAEPEDNVLPNAHYLLPLEPLLRCEAFLQMPQAQAAEPNPLLSRIAANPFVAAGVVCQYGDVGLWRSMARLADELLRHKPNALIHYLIAYALIINKTMATTGAEHIMIAERIDSLQPMPTREFEKKAILHLAKLFPESQRLSLVQQTMGELTENE